MSTATSPTAPPSAPEIVTNAPAATRPHWATMLRSADHKQIGLFYIFTAFAILVLAGTAGLLLRIQLVLPDNTFLAPEKFNRLLTLHDTALLTFVALPLFAGLLTYLVPLLIGARTTAFPRLSAMSYWLVLFGAVTLLITPFFDVPDSGATPTSPLIGEFFSRSVGIDLWATALLLSVTGLTLNAIDLFATVKNLRAPGMTKARLPILARFATVWSVTLLITAPAFAAGLVMLLLDRTFEGVAFFEAAAGGSALLWKNMLWFFVHPAMVLVTLAGVAVTAEVFATAKQTNITGRKHFGVLIALTAGLAVAGWGQRLFAAPLHDALNYLFMVIGLLLVIPVLMMLGNLLTTLARGGFRVTTALLFGIGFAFTFAVAAAQLLLLAFPPIAQQLLGSQFESAVLDTLVVGPVVTAGLAALYHWFPKMTGRLMSEAIGKASFVLTQLGFLLLIGPLMVLGLRGMPLAVFEYADGDSLQVCNIIASAGLLVMIGGVTLTFVNALQSASRGPVAGNDPWHGGTLEWFAPSPPPINNFDVVPTIQSDLPYADLRNQLLADGGALAESVAQPHAAGHSDS